MIDEYRLFWLLDYIIYYLHDEWDFEGETCKYRNQYEDKISNIMISFFLSLLDKTSRSLQKLF